MTNDADLITVDTSISQALSQLERGYDAEVKNFLSEKQILAFILKSCTEEFRDCRTEDIAQKYIEGMPQISTVSVDRDTQDPDMIPFSPGSKITGISNEDKSRNEGLVTYDLRFTAEAPGTGHHIRLIINVEAQRYSQHLRYPLVKRGLYYCSRLISAQKNVEFTDTHYEDIRKVYSIWICPNVSKDREHSIVSYDIAERVIEAHNRIIPEDRSHYDLMSVVVLGLGDPMTKDAGDALRMLSTALSEELDAASKKRILSDEFGIDMTETMERTVDRMCNLSYGITEKAEAKGKAEGKAEGIAIGEMRKLYDLVRKGLLTVQIAAEEAGQTEAEFRAGMDTYLTGSLT